MANDDWHLVLESTHEAVRIFARIEVEALTRKVIHRLQRVHSSGIFGDDYIYKTLWDEYCHEAQNGPHELLENAWEMTIATVLDDVVEQVPRHSAVLLSIHAAWELDEHDAAKMLGSVWPDGIKRLVQDGLGEKAGMRKLHHLGPWRDC